jgi:hypothetical protein
MLKFLFRWTTFLLIPCLIVAQGNVAFGAQCQSFYESSQMARNALPQNERFDRQALEELLKIAFRKPHDRDAASLTRAITAFAERMATFSLHVPVLTRGGESNGAFYTRRAFLSGAVAAAGVPTLARQTLDADDPSLQQLRVDIRSYLSSLANEWEHSQNAKEKTWAPYIRAMADQFVFLEENAQRPIGVGIRKNKEGYLINAQTGLVDFVVALHPGVMRELLNRIRVESVEQQNVSRYQMNTLFVKEIGGLVFAQKHPYAAKSLVVAQKLYLEVRDSFTTQAITDRRAQEIVKYYATAWLAGESAGYVVAGEYLAAHPEANSVIRPQDPSSPVLNMTLANFHVWSKLYSPKNPHRFWEAAMDHVIATEMNHAEGMAVAPAQTEAFDAAFRVEIALGHVESSGAVMMRPRLQASGRPIFEFMSYVENPYYYLATPEEIQTRCASPNLKWFWLSETLIGAAMGGVALLGIRQRNAHAIEQARTRAQALFNALSPKERGSITVDQLSSLIQEPLMNPSRIVAALIKDGGSTVSKKQLQQSIQGKFKEDLTKPKLTTARKTTLLILAATALLAGVLALLEELSIFKLSTWLPSSLKSNSLSMLLVPSPKTLIVPQGMLAAA